MVNFLKPIYESTISYGDLHKISEIAKSKVPGVQFRFIEDVPFSRKIQNKMNEFFGKKVKEIRDYQNKLLKKKHSLDGKVNFSSLGESKSEFFLGNGIGNNSLDSHDDLDTYEKLFCNKNHWTIHYTSRNLPEDIFSREIIRIDLVVPKKSFDLARIYNVNNEKYRKELALTKAEKAKLIVFGDSGNKVEENKYRRVLRDSFLEHL